MKNNIRAVRAPKGQRRKATHPTRERLLDTAMALIETMDIADVTSEMVLEISGLSRGSMYHHFDDFSDLLEQAMIRKFADLVDISITGLSTLLQEATSREDMLAGLSVTVKATHSPENSRNRYFRARIIALAESNERLMQKLAVEQQRLTRALADLFAACQRKGWMRLDFDPAVASIFIQAYTLGRVIDDVSQDKVDPDHWDDFINQAIRVLFF